MRGGGGGGFGANAPCTTISVICRAVDLTPVAATANSRLGFILQSNLQSSLLLTTNSYFSGTKEPKDYTFTLQAQIHAAASAEAVVCRWIKRNLSLVISGVIALGLLGFGGWYLWSAMKKNADIDTQINQAKSEIDRLLNMDPTPTASNLITAKRELERLNAFIAQAKRQFPPTPPAGVPFEQRIVQKSVGENDRRTAQGGQQRDGSSWTRIIISRSPAERESVLFPPESLRPLYERLHEVKMLSEILFKARVAQLIPFNARWFRASARPGRILEPRRAHECGGRAWCSGLTRSRFIVSRRNWPR